MTITGDGIFCTLSNNYSVSNLIPGSVVEWQVSPSNIATPNNPDAPETSLIKTGNGTITLKAIVTNACMVSATVIEKHNIQVGVPDRPILRNEMGNKITSVSTCVDVHKTLCPQVDFPDQILEWEWEKVSGNFNLIVFDNCADVLGYSAGFGIVSVRVRNACGWSNLSLFSVNITDCMMKTPYQIKLSPNPAASIVTLMVNTREENKNLPEATINEVRIYDSFGNLKINKKFAKLQSATIQVEGLKTGVYIMEINTGNGIEHQQLIIQK